MKFKTARITILGDVLDVVAIVVRAVARFFVTGGHYRECRRHKPCRGGGSGGILPQKIFKFGGSEMLFSALVSEKSTSNMKMANNCKSL